MRRSHDQGAFSFMTLVLLGAAGWSAESAAPPRSDVYPYPVFPSAPVPGWPGVDADDNTTRNKLATKDGQGSDIPAIYGQPEFLAYPGAVHHERSDLQRYVPSFPLCNQKTLVKNFIFHELPAFADRCVPWQEPVYYVPMYDPDRVPTRQRRPAVRVYPWRSDSPAIRLELGKLPTGLYVMRCILADPEVTDGSWQKRRYAVIQFGVNDDPRGPERLRPYILRAPVIDNFYAVQEFFFHSRGDRAYRCEFTLHPASTARPFLYNIDLHDRYGDLARKQGKRGMVFVDAAARQKQWEANRKDKGFRGFAERSPDEQRKIDDKIWYESMPPLNCHVWAQTEFYYPFNYATDRTPRADPAQRFRDSLCPVPEQWLTSDDPEFQAVRRRLERVTKPHVYVSSEERAHVYGGKLREDPPLYALKGGEYWGLVGQKWQRLGPIADGQWKENKLLLLGREVAGLRQVEIRNVDRFRRAEPDGKLEKYHGTRPDYLGRRYFDAKGQHHCLAEFDLPPGVYCNAYWTSFVWPEGWRYHSWTGPKAAHPYARWGDPNYARDTALRLVRVAYDWPNMNPSRDLGGILGTKVLHRQVNRRYQWNAHHDGMVAIYDALFDFLKDNQEFAAAVHRYLPWVQTPADVLALLDTTILQDHANDIMKFRYWYDHGYAQLLLNVVMAQDNVELTRPWMEHLWTCFFEYPQAISGLGEALVTNNGRDGGTTIGSYFYTSGPPVVEPARLLEGYILRGGDKRFDLTDPLQYPVSRAAVYLPFEAQAAGRHNPGVGDVGGPSQAYGRCPPARETIEAGWRWTRDPKFAWELVHNYGRALETDAEWARIESAAAKCPRDPYLMNRSRALSDWGAYLTAGQESDDFRFKREVAVRVGLGTGHSHADTLDLRLWAHGVTMSGDMGQRVGYGRPGHGASRVHNVVEVDGASWEGYSWVRSLFDAKGAPYAACESVAPRGRESVRLFRRQNALIDVDPGRPSTKAPPQTDADVVTPSSYVFDVFRVSGGSMHTYCYHGVVDDQFDVNVTRRRNITERQGGPDEEYLARFAWRDQAKDPDANDVEWAADPAGDTLVATWRLARAPGSDQPEKRMVTCMAPQFSGAMTAPRKYNRLHLFQQTGSRILHGICRDNTLQGEHHPAKPGYCGRCLFAQKRGRQGEALESAFTAVVELYAGQPFIASAKAINIAGNEGDALRAVALEVKTTNGHSDLCFADGRPEKLRSLKADGIGELKISGDYAYVSCDKDGLRQATLAGGRLLTAPGLALEVKDVQYGGRIADVDYLNRKVTLDARVPGVRFAGAFFEAGGEFHKSSHEVSGVQQVAGRSVLALRKGIEIMRSRIVRFDPQTGVLRTRIAMLRARGNDRDLTASNEACTKFWKLESTGQGNRHEGWEFRLVPREEYSAVAEPSAQPARLRQPIPASDIEAGQVLRVWEFGVGDRFSIRTGATLRRVDRDVYEVYATSPLCLTLAARSLAVSRDGKNWQDLAISRAGDRVRAEIGESLIDAGALLVRVRR